jgi:hypothetical protein
LQECRWLTIKTFVKATDPREALVGHWEMAFSNTSLHVLAMKSTMRTNGEIVLTTLVDLRFVA